MADGVDLDARQQRVGREVLQARGLLHDVRAGEVVAAHLENLAPGSGPRHSHRPPSCRSGWRPDSTCRGTRRTSSCPGSSSTADRRRPWRRPPKARLARFRSPPACITLPTEAETLVMICSGFQSISAIFLMACAANFGVVMLIRSTSAPAGLELDDVGVDRRLRDLVAFLGDDHRGRLGAESVLQALEVVLAEIVVLIEHGDLGVRLFLQQYFA